MDRTVASSIHAKHLTDRPRLGRRTRSRSSVPRLTDILDVAAVYRLWQLPFRQAQLAPILRTNDVSASGRVLDVGCGPGTNADVFRHARYLGGKKAHG